MQGVTVAGRRVVAGSYQDRPASSTPPSDLRETRLKNPRESSLRAIRRAARARCDTRFFASADHWPSVSPPGGSPGRLEDRVVAEAARALRRDGDPPPAACRAPCARSRTAARRSGQDQGEDADVARAAPLGRQAASASSSLRVVLGVGGVSPA